MRRRYFVQIASTLLGGMALKNPLWASIGDGEFSDANRLEAASQNILRSLHRAGLLTPLAVLNARVLGGSVYALVRGFVPDQLQLSVKEDRFEEGCRALGDSPHIAIELWSDRFSCHRIGSRTSTARLFSSLNYLTRFESLSPLGDLFRHQRLSFNIAQQEITDPSGWLMSDHPRVEISPQIHRQLGAAARRELLLLAGWERTYFGIEWGDELQAWQRELPAPLPPLPDFPTGRC